MGIIFLVKFLPLQLPLLFEMFILALFTFLKRPVQTLLKNSLWPQVLSPKGLIEM